VFNCHRHKKAEPNRFRFFIGLTQNAGIELLNYEPMGGWLDAGIAPAPAGFLASRGRRRPSGITLKSDSSRAAA
jgi:hypothetical protein